jgi:hypothetical protein
MANRVTPDQGTQLPKTMWERSSAPTKFYLICATIPGVNTISSLAFLVLKGMHKGMEGIERVLSKHYPNSFVHRLVYRDLNNSSPLVTFLKSHDTIHFLLFAIPLVSTLAAIVIINDLSNRI